MNFSEEQKLEILKSAYHLGEASKHLIKLNGMLAGIINSMSLELISQTGYLDEIQSSSKSDLTDKEKSEVDELIKSIQDSLKE